MCRMILAFGDVDCQAVLDAAVQMGEGRTADHCGPIRRHPDGWGALCHQMNGTSVCETFVHRTTDSISQSLNTFQMPKGSTNFMIVHARHATREDNRGIEFTHPLLHRENQWYLFHNGYLPTVCREIGLTTSQFDSREYLDFLLPPGVSDLDKDRVIARLERLDSENTSGNAFLVGQNRAYAISWFHRQNPYPDFYTMWTVNHNKALFISSECVPSLAPREQWKPIARASVVEIEFNSLCQPFCVQGFSRNSPV